MHFEMASAHEVESQGLSEIQNCAQRPTVPEDRVN